MDEYGMVQEEVNHRKKHDVPDMLRKIAECSFRSFIESFI